MTTQAEGKDMNELNSMLDENDNSTFNNSNGKRNYEELLMTTTCNNNSESVSQGTDENQQHQTQQQKTDQQQQNQHQQTQQNQPDQQQQKKSNNNNNNNDNINNKIKKKHMNQDLLAFRYKIHECCKTNDIGTAMNAYHDAIIKNIKIEPQSFYTLLNLCDGINPHREIHIGTPKSTSQSLTATTNTTIISKLPNDKDDDNVKVETTNVKSEVDDICIEKRIQFSEDVKAHMDLLKLPLTESAYFGLIKLYCKYGDMDKAEYLLKESEVVQQCKSKLRLYTTVIKSYCDKNNLKKAIQIWYQCSLLKFNISEKDYISLIQCCTIVGNVYVMEKVLSQLAEDIVIPCKETTKSIIAWFQSIHSIKNNDNTTTSDSNNNDTDDNDILSMIDNIKNQNAEEVVNMGPVQCETQNSWIINENCTIDENNGILLSGCLQGLSLQSIQVSNIAWNHMIDMNDSIVTTGKVLYDTSEYQGGGKGKKKIHMISPIQLIERTKHWNIFKTYINHRNQYNPIDIVIDGANVGYYDTNYNNAPKHVCYEQIDILIQHLLAQKKSILLILHSRHFEKNLMPKQYDSLIQTWIQNDIIYKTPPGMNDDWFWLHAVLLSKHNQNTLVITNDEMRDHQFQMLAPRSFIRWKDRHQIHFSFTGSGEMNHNNKRNINNRDVILQYPNQYSRRIQRISNNNGLIIPHPKRGDTNRFLDGTFDAMDNEPIEETYVCICPYPNTSQQQQEDEKEENESNI